MKVTKMSLAGNILIKFKHALKYCLKIRIKILVWHSHIFILPCITVEENFIIGIAFIFNLYCLCFVVDELPAFIVIANNL